jgi:hypothetical protein
MLRFLHLKNISINIKYIKSIRKYENQYTIDMNTNGTHIFGMSFARMGFITSKGEWEQITIFKNEDSITDYNTITKFLETGNPNDTPIAK